MAKYVLAIDQGTTGSTALLIDQGVNVVAKVNVEFPNHYPKPGQVEHDVDATELEGFLESCGERCTTPEQSPIRSEQQED